MLKQLELRTEPHSQDLSILFLNCFPQNLPKNSWLLAVFGVPLSSTIMLNTFGVNIFLKYGLLALKKKPSNFGFLVIVLLA